MPVLNHCHAQFDEAAVQARAAALLAQMTQEEKIGQLVQYSQPGEETGPAMRSEVESEITAGRCGSMLNVAGADRTRAMQRLAVEHSRLRIPLLFGYDVVHGFRTIFPVNLGQAASFDLEAIQNAERIAATEAAAAGIHWTFAPMVDIARDPRWGRIVEGSGEDPFLGSAIACARVRGFQGDDLSRIDTVLACAKHFAGYGAAQAGRDYSTTEIPEITLRDVHLPPFKAAVDAGVATIMAAFNDLNGIPCSANEQLMTRILRREWGFRGFVVSDWMSIRELLAHGVAADEAEACRIAMNAGLDIDMEGRIYGPQMMAQIEAGAISEARLDEAVSAVLAAKMRLGLFDDPYRYCDEARERSSLLQPSSLAAARDLARKSCVLLKNNGAVLPLRRDMRIALVGSLADMRRDLLGPFAARKCDEDAATIREALEAACPGRIVHAAGCNVDDDDRSGFNDAISVANNADIIVAVMGEGWDMSGEASSRSNLDLPGCQLELLAELRKTGKPLVLVLLTGRPLLLAPVLECVDALLLAWFPGTMGAAAIADLLLGEFNPSGKLPATFPRSLGQVPIFCGHKNGGRPLDPSAPKDKFKSQYLDVQNSPQFPFGFGLSYTTFAYSEQGIDADTLTPDGQILVLTTVTNTGERDGTEIVQLYVRDVAGSVTRPVRELKGFQRVALKARESRRIIFTLRPDDLAFHRPDMRFSPEPGRFEVFVGGDSTAPKIGDFVYTDSR